jgi:hypothetical protein
VQSPRRPIPFPRREARENPLSGPDIRATVHLSRQYERRPSPTERTPGPGRQSKFSAGIALASAAIWRLAAPNSMRYSDLKSDAWAARFGTANSKAKHNLIFGKYRTAAGRQRLDIGIPAAKSRHYVAYATAFCAIL